MVICSNVNSVGAFEKPTKKYALGIDLGYTLWSSVRADQDGIELIYRHYLNDRFYIHESAGLAFYNEKSQGKPLEQYRNFNGYFNRIGVHYQFYKPHWFHRSKFKRDYENERNSFGFNILAGALDFKYRLNATGPLLVPYQVSGNDKYAFVGIEAQANVILLKIEGFQLIWMTRFGVLKPNKKVTFIDYTTPFPGSSLQGEPTYGEIIGFNALYRFN